MWKRYAEMALDVAIGLGAYRFLGWVGLALWVFFVVCNYLSQLLTSQQVMTKTLLSRLPDRCAFCHREIVDEGGVFDEDGIYHEACADKLESLEELRKEAGVPYSQAIQNPRPRAVKW